MVLSGSSFQCPYRLLLGSDGNGKAHKVYLITVGEFLRYAAYTYYYTDNDYENKTVYEYTINHRGVIEGTK